jgi:hypothetical protein
MISSAEQQFVIKLQDEEELERRYLLDVLAHKRLENVQKSGAVLAPDRILEAVTVLGEDCRLEFRDGMWNIDLGGADTKKKVKIRAERQHIALAKAMIIYVRKYL